MRRKKSPLSIRPGEFRSTASRKNWMG